MESVRFDRLTADVQAAATSSDPQDLIDAAIMVAAGLTDHAVDIASIKKELACYITANRSQPRRRFGRQPRATTHRYMLVLRHRGIRYPPTGPRTRRADLRRVRPTCDPEPYRTQDKLTSSTAGQSGLHLAADFACRSCRCC